jgi:phosphoribosylglycinamide formyltransferase-1
VLVSGAGSNLQALVDAARDPAYAVDVVGVGADRDDIEGLERARRQGIPTFSCRLADHGGRAAWDRELARQISAYRPDLVVSAGFMKILGAEVLDAQPVVNTHPALLPAFPGAHAVADALAYGVRVTGCTAHLLDAGVDTGPILDQRAVPVLDGDTEPILHERIKTVERPMLVDVVGRLARHGYTVIDRKVTIP